MTFVFFVFVEDLNVIDIGQIWKISGVDHAGLFDEKIIKEVNSAKLDVEKGGKKKTGGRTTANSNPQNNNQDNNWESKLANVLQQVLDKSIDSDLMFPWIKEYKESIAVSKKRIHLICGKDDVVVGEGGMEYLAKVLNDKGNEVSSTEPNKLPHNNPELAASHIYSFIKKEFSL